MTWHHLEDRECRAAKQYVCCLCGLRIRKGAKHIVRKGFDDGRCVTMRMHAVCEAATWDWDEMSWELGCEEAEFREYELGICR